MSWYTFDQESQHIITVEGCGWPGLDSKGNEMYENTHFKTFAECREHTRQELYLGMEDAVSEMKNAKHTLSKSVEAVAGQAERYTSFVECYPLHKGPPYGK